MLDPTVFWTAPALIAITCTAVFGALALYAPDMPGLRVLLLAPLFQTIALSAMGLPLSILDQRGHGLVLGLFSLSLPYIWAVGIQRFHGRPSLARFAVACLGLGVFLAITLRYVWSQDDVRRILVNVIMIVGWVSATMTLWRTPAGLGRLPARVLALGFFAIGCNLFVATLLLVSGHHTPSLISSSRPVGGDLMSWVLALTTTALSAPVLAMLVAARFKERIEAEKHRTEASEALFRGLAVSTSAGILVTNDHGECTYGNPRAHEILGLEPGALLGDGWQSAFTAEALPELLSSVASDPPVAERTYKIVASDGSTRWVSWRPAVRDITGSGSFVTTIDDITALLESHTRVRELAQRLETMREIERASLAYALHEDVAQDLTAIEFLLRGLRASRDGGTTLTAARELVGNELRRCTQKLRDLTSSMRPPMLAHLSLPDAIEEYAQLFSKKQGIAVKVVRPTHFLELDEAARVVFFRAAEEALSNVVQHAGAQCATVTFEVKDGMPVMTIRDDGIGMTDKNLTKRHSLGILGLRERFAALGGGVEIGRNEPSGTTMTVYLPASVENAIRAQSRRTGRLVADRPTV